MERFAWKAKVLPGMLDEYIKRHDEIWPEMTELLNQAGIHNYTIWNVGNELFGYYECRDIQFALAVQKESAVVARWNEYMRDVMEMDAQGKSGSSDMLRAVFLHK